MSAQDGTNTDFSAGPSEMHARISAHDWSETPVGPVEAWPQNLKATIKVLLGSRYPMMLLWSSDLIQLYNDAYAGLIGDKHPHALGHSIRETQAESWEAIGPLIQEVMATGAPRWAPTQMLPLERSGCREETYFNLSCRAVEDDAGVIQGVLCACNEVTEQVIDERRQQILCDLGVKAGGGTRSVEETCQGLATAIAEQPLDVPFALIYLRAPDGQTLALRGAAGLEEGREASPLLVDLQAEGNEGWPFAQVAAGETALVEEVERHAPLLSGPFDQPVRSAMMMPLTASGQAAPFGVLVAGVSPNRALDEDHRSFYELLAEQVSAGVRSAQAYEKERRRLQAEIAERKRAEEDLKKTNAALARRAAELDAIFQSLPGAVYVGNEAGITRANQEALEQLGYADLEELNHNIAELAEQIQTRHLRSGERLSPEEEPFARALRGESFAQNVVVRHRKTGKDKIVYCSAAPIRLGGKVIGAVAINTDITERVRTAEALRESEERKQAMLESALDCIITIDHHGRILEFNPAAERTFGYAHDSVIGRPLDEIIVPPRLREDHQRGMARFLETGHRHILGRRLEMPAMHADGSEFPAELTITCTRQDGAPPFFTGFLRDITERKQTRAELQEAQERSAFLAEASAVLASSLDFQKTLQQVADLAASYLADWCIVAMAGEEVAPGQLAPGQVAVAHADPSKVARAGAHARRYPPDPDARFGSPHVIRTGRSELYEEVTDEVLAAFAHDAEHLKLLQQVGFESAMAVPMQVHGETLGAITFISTDPGRRYGEADLHLAEELAHRAAMEVRNARLYQEAKQDRTRAEEMSRLKSAFLANMSHEIRTPLTGIIGFASLLARRLPEKEGDYARRIERGGQRLMDTLGAVLSLSQLEAREAQLQFETLPVAKEVRQAARLLEGPAREKNLALSFAAQPGAEEARARLDPGAFNSVLNNLISNAIKFTDQGSINVTVEADAEHARVHVEDTGAGIDEAFVPHLFDAFRQESRGWNRSHEGTGLGLSIAQQLTEQMGGEITVQSEKGRGSRFTVHLPLAQESADEAAPQEGQPEASPPEPAAPRLLVVEDNADTRILMQTLLERLGEVKTASTAEEALAAARHTLEAGADGAPLPFDLFLVDINLGPGKSGEDILDEVRALPAYRTVPMAAVTAYALPGDRERLLARGFDAFLPKPFRADVLIDLASELLQR